MKTHEFKDGVLLYATSIREIGQSEKWMVPSILKIGIGSRSQECKNVAWTLLVRCKN
jgi:hypothetical protein